MRLFLYTLFVASFFLSSYALSVPTKLSTPSNFKTNSKSDSESDTLEQWILKESEIAKTRMYANISPAGSASGIIIASPQRDNPDYYFHWIRDSALVIEAVFIDAHNSPENTEWVKAFTDLIELSQKIQGTPAITGLGEPRFNIDGSPYSGDWARPQNDGPALRVLASLRGKELLKKHKLLKLNAELEEKISKVVAIDVEYLLSHWNQPCYDLWEEVRGQHFYTRRVQLAAVQAALTDFDPRWAFTKEQLQQIETQLQQSLEQHWEEQKGYFAITRDRLDGAEKYKFTDLDVAVILSGLHAKAVSGKLGLEDDRMLATLVQLENEFQRIYAVNQPRAEDPGVPAIGRYTDDVYFGGNPWYLTTAAFAEVHYKLAQLFRNQKSILVTARNQMFLQRAWELAGKNLPALEVGMNLGRSKRLRTALSSGLKLRGDRYLQRLKLHTPADGGMAEQFERNHGTPVSARDLTWSYAGFLTAIEARKALTSLKH